MKTVSGKHNFLRILDFSKVLQRKSVFLFGPRQVGKSTYLREKFKTALYINLLNLNTQRELMANPERLREMITEYRKNILQSKSKKSNNGTVTSAVIIIDEIQKMPILLDEIHNHIENFKEDRFILTGSSARKLKKHGVNLLGGRAHQINFSAIVYPERNDAGITWKKVLQWGSLPSILLSEDPKEDLQDYVNLYLKEEIKEESLVRSLASFSSFLDMAATVNGQQLVYESLSSDVGVSAVTIKEYFQILEDTLMAERLPAYRKGTRRKIHLTPKFYFFDTGVANTLLNRFNIKEKTPEFGVAFEQLIYIEIRSYINIYSRNNLSLFYLRTYDKQEIDFIVENQETKIWAIEAKGSSNVDDKQLKAIRSLEEEGLKMQAKIVVTSGGVARTTKDGIDILPIDIFLQRLWSKKIFS